MIRLRIRLVHGLLLILLLPNLMWGITAFEVFRTEDDIIEAYQEGRIDQDTYGDLLDLYWNKVDINTDEIDQLTLIPGIDHLQVLQIRDQRRRKGDLKTVADLQEISDLDYEKLSAFVRVTDYSLPFKGLASVRADQYLAEDDKLRNEINSGLYIRDHLALKGQYYHDRDDGSVWKERALYITNLSYIKKAVIGHYKTSFGQKLVLGGDFNLGVAGVEDHIVLPGTDRDVKSYSNGSYLDGVLLVLGAQELRVKFCYSEKDLFLYEAETPSSTSLAHDRLAGGSIEYTGKPLSLGVSGLASGIGVLKSTTYLKVGGAHFTFRKKGWTLFGEAAQVAGNGFGLVTGGRWQAKGFSTKAIYRHYAPGFLNFYSRGMADADGDDNDSDEEGWQVRTSFKARENLRLWGFFDFWKTLSAFTSHYEQEAGATWYYKNKGRLSASARFTDRDIAREGDTRQEIRVNTRYPVSKVLSLSGEMKYRRKTDASELVTHGGYTWAEGSVLPWKGTRVSGRFKFTNYDISHYQDGYYTLYLAEESTFLQHWFFLAKYTHTIYNDPGSESRKHIRVQLGLHWE